MSRISRWGGASATVLVAATIGAVCAIAASAHPSALTLSIKTKPGVIYFKAPSPDRSRIEGALGSGKQGVKLDLMAQEWPFKAPPTQVASTSTDRHGRYAFVVAPTLATRYHVVRKASGLRSATRTVIVVTGYSDVTCDFSNAHGSVSCAHAERHGLKSGKYTLRWSLEYLYPASAYGIEKTGRAYSYYGQRDGSHKHPSTLSLQGTVAQQPRSGDRTYLAFKASFTAPGTEWAFRTDACTQTREKSDGFGLPGAPGSHHCGQQTITYRQATSRALG